MVWCSILLVRCSKADTAADTEGWTFTSPTGGPMAMHVKSMAGDSIVTDAGPFERLGHTTVGSGMKSPAECAGLFSIYINPVTFATQTSLCKSLKVKYNQPAYSAIPLDALLCGRAASSKRRTSRTAPSDMPNPTTTPERAPV